MIAAEQHKLLGLRRSWFIVEATEEELLRLTGRKRFTIQNVPVYLALVSTWDMLVTDLASWAKAAYSEGGFFGRLRAIGGPSRAARRPAEERRRSTSQLQDMLDESHTKTFRLLFPTSRDKPSAKEMDALRVAFMRTAEKLVDDRDNHRAHKFEKRSANRVVERQSRSQVGEFFDYAEDLLAKLRLVSSSTTFDMSELNQPPAREVAPHLVDMILVRSPGEARAGFRNAGGRAEFYAKLHEAHESAGREGSFNDWRYVAGLVPWQARTDVRGSDSD